MDHVFIVVFGKDDIFESNEVSVKSFAQKLIQFSPLCLELCFRQPVLEVASGLDLSNVDIASGASMELVNQINYSSEDIFWF